MVHALTNGAQAADLALQGGTPIYVKQFMKDHGFPNSRWRGWRKAKLNAQSSVRNLAIRSAVRSDPLTPNRAVT
jgi:hypothetical protein